MDHFRNLMMDFIALEAKIFRQDKGKHTIVRHTRLSAAQKTPQLDTEIVEKECFQPDTDYQPQDRY